MNMILTGGFGSFQDAPSNSKTLASKRTAEWLRKNGGKARVGGVSLMAVSLAACGSSSTTTTTSSTDTTDTTTTTPVGKTYVLTKDVIDNIAGGAGDDTIIGDATTVVLADQVDGGDGSDTYTHYDHAVLPTLSNVETLKVVKQSDNDNLDVSETGATTFIIDQDGGTNNYTIAADMDVTIQNTVIDNAGTDLEINTTSTDTAITITLDKVTSLGTSTQLEIDGAKLATINLNTTGTKSSIDQIINTGGKVTKLDIGADVKLTVVDALPTTIKTIDASDSTAAVDLQTGTVDLTFTGGEGDDRLNLGALSNLDASDALDPGAGKDTVATSDSGAKFSGGELTTIKAELAKFEVLEYTATLNGGAGNELNIDYNEISVINEVLMSADMNATDGTDAATDASTATAGDVAVTITGIEAGDILVIGDDENVSGGDGGDADTTVASGAVVGGDGADGATAISLTEDVSTADNSFTITLSGNNDITGGTGGDASSTDTNGAGTGSSAGDGGDAITATGIETLTIISNGDGTTADNNNIAGGAGGAEGETSVAAAGTAGSSVVMGTNGKIVVQGNQNLDLGTVEGTNVIVDASDFTGKLTVTGEAGNNVIKGGSAVDTIDGGEGADIITGGAGNDIFVFSTAANSDTAAYDTIKDFAAGDVLRFEAADNVAGASPTGGTTATNNVEVASGGKVTFASADSTLAKKLTAIAADGTDVNTDEIAFFEHDGSTYVFNNVGGTDDLVKLEGVTGFTTLTESTVTAGDFTLA